MLGVPPHLDAPATEAAPAAPAMRFTTPAPGQTPRYDLMGLLQRTGRASNGGTLQFPEERTDSTTGVELIESEPVKISAAPAKVWAFLDGIQNQVLLTYRNHRPVVLAYAAAGAAGNPSGRTGGGGAELVGLSERLALVCAQADLDWLTSVNTVTPPLPISPVPDGTPPEVTRVVLEQVARMRAACEIDLRNRLLAEAPLDHLLVLDGSLLGSETDTRLAAVVKTTATRYLNDESLLYGLPAGWRSPIFKLPTSGGTAERYSAYVRLHSAAAHEWSFGLIRVESFYPEIIDALAARTMIERQGAASGDGRWDRHLVSVATCEKLLRARRPVVFST